MSNTTLSTLLEQREDEFFDAQSTASFFQEAESVEELLENALLEAIELPVEADDVSAMQFHSQDNLDGFTDSDLTTKYHPDNTAPLNHDGMGSARNSHEMVSFLVGSNCSKFSEGADYQAETEIEVGHGGKNDEDLDDITAEDLAGVDDDFFGEF